MKQICEELRLTKDIILDGKVECWIEDFELWLKFAGSRTFPSIELESDLAKFSKSFLGQTHFYKNYIGLIDGKLKFTMIRALSQGK